MLNGQQHKPGVLVGNEAAPSFSAKTIPPGTAPPERTFEPNPTSEFPSQSLNDQQDSSTYTSASSTLGGATSADVHTGLGKPLQGETSVEQRHEGQHQRKNPGGHGAGLVGVGASGVSSGNQGADERVQESQRALEREEGAEAGKRGDKTEAGAEDSLNEQF